MTESNICILCCNTIIDTYTFPCCKILFVQNVYLIT